MTIRKGEGWRGSWERARALAEEQDYVALHDLLDGLLPEASQADRDGADVQAGLLALRARARLNLGHWEKAIHDARIVLILAGRLKLHLAVFEAHQVLGEYQRNIGEFGEAVHSHQNALRVAEALGEPVAEAEASLALAGIHSRMGDPSLGDRRLQHARQLLAGLPHSRRVCRVLAVAMVQEGLDRFRQGRVEETFALYQEALCLLSDDPRSLEAGEAWRFLGLAASARMHHRRALECHMQAMEIFSQRRCRYHQARLYGSMGQSLQEMGRIDEAIILYERAESICNTLGARASTAKLHGRLGQAFLARGDCERALEHFGRDLSLTRMSGGRRALAHMHRRLGQGLREKGDVREALEHFDESLRLFQDMGDQLGEARLHREIALAHIRQGHGGLSREAAERAQDLFVQLRQEHDAVHMQALLGVIARLGGDLVEAENRFQEALVFFSVEEPLPHLAETLYEYGLLQMELGCPERGRENFLEALRMARSLQLHGLATKCFTMLEEMCAVEGVRAVMGDLAV